MTASQEPLAYRTHFQGDRNSQRSTHSQDPIPDTNGYGGRGASASNDPRGAYALQVQRACKDAVREVKQNSMLAESNWAEPLTAAPTAISVMAFLLKTAANKKVAGLGVSSTEVRDEKGKNLVGTLPSPYFHTNLMHCSDIGRLAFQNAENRMYKINAITNRIIEDGGQIGYIVEMLGDPEDAKDNLKPEMEDLRSRAAECSQECEAIKERFEYWQHVIFHLAKAAADHMAKTSQKQKEVSGSKAAASIDKSMYSTQADAARENIKNLKSQIHTVTERANRAECELDRLLAREPIEEPSRYHDEAMLDTLAPKTQAEKLDKGKVRNAFNTLFRGTTDEDREHAAAHEEKQLKRRQQLFAEEKARREAEIAKAKQEVADARRREAKVYSDYDEACNDLSLQQDRLAQAQARLARASHDWERLEGEELELEQLIDILKESTNELAALKSQMAEFIKFFSKLEANISTTAMADVNKFLDVLERNTKYDEHGTPTVQLRKTTKKNVLVSALKIQGQLSQISDISAVYVKISSTWIREAINRMELLATVKDADWKTERAKFNIWCKQAIENIHSTSRDTTANMGANLNMRIGMVEQLAIEANADSQ